MQRRFATPVPRVADLDELNRFFRIRCKAERLRVVHALSGPFVIGDRLAEDIAAAALLPVHRFDPCVIRPAVPVDKYQTVPFNNNRYSVPRALAFRVVTVKGYVDRVVVVADGQVVTDHARSLGKSRMVLDPLHYLAALGRKPGSLDHAPVFRDSELPACFAELRAALEEQHGQQGGSRRFVRGLQLMNDHPMTRVGQVVEACLREHIVSAEAVIQRTRTLAATEAAASARPRRRPARHRPSPRCRCRCRT